MKALCTFFVLAILVAGGAIAFRTFAPDQWNALIGAAAVDTPEATQPVEETPEATAPAPEDTPATPPTVGEKPSPAAKAKATDKSKPRTADRPAAKPVDHPANASGQIGWGVVASIKPTFYNKKGKRIETKFAPKAGTPFVVTKEIAADGEPAYVVIFDTHPNKPECVLLGSDCSIILTPPPDIAPDSADALVAPTSNAPVTNTTPPPPPKTSPNSRPNSSKSPAKTASMKPPKRPPRPTPSA